MQKSISNLAKHRISFDSAITAFDDPFALIAPDQKLSNDEYREWLIGEASAGVLVVIFTRRDRNVLRIISARKANSKERKSYEEAKRISI